MNPIEQAHKLLTACYNLQATGKYSADVIFHMQTPALTNSDCVSIWIHAAEPAPASERIAEYVAVPIADTEQISRIIQSIEQIGRDASGKSQDGS